LADGTPGGGGHRLHPNLFRTVALQSLGRTADANHSARRGRTLGEALGASWALPVYHFLAALGHWDAGNWDDLLAEVDAGLTHSEEQASTIGQVWAYATAGRVHVHRGELATASSLVDRGERMLAEHGPQFGADWLALTQALLLEAQGRRADGLDALRFVWEAATGLRASAALILVGGDLTRLAVEAGDDATGHQVVTALTALAAVSPDDPVLAARLARSRGLAERDPVSAQAAVDAFDTLGHRFEAALVREELADLELASGATASAAALLERVLGTCDELRAIREADRVSSKLARLRPRGHHVPAPRLAVSGWDALTPTESLVVDEICAGRANKEVADRLGISRRTVEAHLRSIYPKLGVTGRLALVIAAGERQRS
jgi:ATP/maltotriose-dependent transcriptional regulator MalT